jgi:hypothetical protein
MKRMAKNAYASLEEAKVAAQRLGIRTKKGYRKRRSEDPRLPSAPDCLYSEFVDWGNFLGTGRNRRLAKDCYQTLAEVRKAALRLGAKSSVSYREVYKDDPKLPRNPAEMFPDDFPGWEVFLKP